MTNQFKVLETGRLSSNNTWIWVKYTGPKSKTFSHILFLFDTEMKLILCAAGRKGKSMYNQYKGYNKHTNPVIGDMGFSALLSGLVRSENSVIPLRLWDKYYNYRYLEVFDDGPGTATLNACMDRFNYYDSIGCKELFESRASLPVIALLGTHFCATDGTIEDKTERWRHGNTCWKAVKRYSSEYEGRTRHIGRTSNPPSGYVGVLVRHHCRGAEIDD